MHQCLIAAFCCAPVNIPSTVKHWKIYGRFENCKAPESLQDMFTRHACFEWRRLPMSSLRYGKKQSDYRCINVSLVLQSISSPKLVQRDQETQWRNRLAELYLLLCWLPYLRCYFGGTDLVRFACKYLSYSQKQHYLCSSSLLNYSHFPPGFNR